MPAGSDVRRAAGLVAGAGAVLSAYMLFEAQWLVKREQDLAVPCLP
jgi:hypothetical protein